MLFIANGTLYPMTGGKERVERGSIAVEDGKILRAGTGFSYEDICTALHRRKGHGKRTHILTPEATG